MRIADLLFLDQFDVGSRNNQFAVRTGCDLEHVVKATVHLHHLGRDFAGFDATYQKFVQTPYPAGTTVGSFLSDFLVEIDVIAALPESARSRR